MRSDANALVSVIVPIYNTEKYLDQCLGSIRGQTHEKLEIICINDGSTDGSLDIMRRHAAEDDRVRIIDKENGGYGAGCNRGIAEARGEWISIIEPDDYIDAGMYEGMLQLAGRFDEVIDVVKTPWRQLECWDDPETLKVRPCRLATRMTTSEAPFTLADHPELIEYHPSIWSAIYRKGFLDERGIRFIEYPGAGWADNPFLIETLCQAQAILYLDRAFYRYRADLPGSTLNHATEDAVRRPFDRWLTMLDVIERLGVQDRGILESHYIRGFNYVEGAQYDDGEDNPIVVAGAREVFGRMDEDIVLSSPKLSGRRKKLYRRTLGEPTGTYLNPARIKYVFADAYSYLKVYGFADLMGRVRIRLFGRKRPETKES